MIAAFERGRSDPRALPPSARPAREPASQSAVGRGRPRSGPGVLVRLPRSTTEVGIAATSAGRESGGWRWRLAVGDLAGALSLEAVTQQSLRFRGSRARRRHRRGDRRSARRVSIRSGFAALGLGKHGSRELNYSSDIDPILIFDPDTLPRRAREEPVEAAVRIARRVVELLQTIDGDGYVFRVDLSACGPRPRRRRWRCPSRRRSLITNRARLPWERAALHPRTRAAAGDVALGERFLGDDPSVRVAPRARFRRDRRDPRALPVASAPITRRGSASGRATTSSAGGAASARSSFSRRSIS